MGRWRPRRWKKRSLSINFAQPIHAPCDDALHVSVGRVTMTTEINKKTVHNVVLYEFFGIRETCDNI